MALKLVLGFVIATMSMATRDRDMGASRELAKRQVLMPSFLRELYKLEMEEKRRQELQQNQKRTILMPADLHKALELARKYYKG